MERERCSENGPKKPVFPGTAFSRDRTPRRIRMEGPDGGWAWVVALSACVISFIMAGLGRMSGILYVTFIETFHVDRMSASTPFSMRSSVRNLLGPVVGILGQKYGVRPVTITGGILATISASACFFAPDIAWITALWGVINGIGTSLTVTLPQVVIGEYFINHLTTASGMAFSGGCVGAFVFPVLLEELLYHYGLQGTFLIIGAIIMHTIPCAIVLRKPPWLRTESKKKQLGAEEYHCTESLLSQKGVSGLQKSDSVGQTGNLKLSSNDTGPDVQFLRQNKDLVLEILTSKALGDDFITFGMEINQNETSIEVIVKELEEIYSSVLSSPGDTLLNPNIKVNRGKQYCELMRKDYLKSSCNHNKSNSFLWDRHLEFGLSDVPKTNSVPDFLRKSYDLPEGLVSSKLRKLLDLNLAVLSSLKPHQRSDAYKVISELKKLYGAHVAVRIPMKGSCIALTGVSSYDADTTAISQEANSHPNTFRDHIKTALNLHRKPLFLLICLCRSVHFVTFLPVMTVVVDFAMDKGMKEADGKYAIAALSLGDLLGRLCFGWITDREYMSLPKYMLVVMALQGISTFSLPLMDTKYSLYTMLVVFGLLQGSLFVRHNVLVSKYMESHEQSIAMGCFNFFSGILGLGFPAYIGYFRDTVGSYDWIFYINGVLGILTGFMWIFEPYFQRCSSTPKKDSSTSV